MIVSVLIRALAKTLVEGIIWINKFVPKRTGQLRRRLIRNMRNVSHVYAKGNLQLYAGTSLRYAKYVNRYTEANVRHSATDKENSGEWATAYYGGHKGRITLDDPKAIGNYNSVMNLYLRGQLRKAIREEIFNIVPQPFRKIFAVKLRVINK